MVEDIFEGSTRWPRRSCGTAGGAHSQFNRVVRQLSERSRETWGFETRAERDLMLVLHRLIEPTRVKRTLAELQTPFAAGAQWKFACRFSVIGSIRGITHLQAASEEV